MYFMDRDYFTTIDNKNINGILSVKDLASLKMLQFLNAQPKSTGQR